MSAGGAGHCNVNGAQHRYGAFGSDRVADIARQLGLTHGETAGHLADLLPQGVDRLTPNGQIPEGGVSASDITGFEGISDLLGRFSKP